MIHVYLAYQSSQMLMMMRGRIIDVAFKTQSKSNHGQILISVRNPMGWLNHKDCVKPVGKKIIVLPCFPLLLAAISDVDSWHCRPT